MFLKNVNLMKEKVIRNAAGDLKIYYDNSSEEKIKINNCNI